MTVLVVAAHPDDEILGIGGTAAVHAARGDKVILAVMCEGVSVRYAPERHEEVCAQIRRAGEILGAAEVHIGSLPDQRLDTMAVSEVAAPLEELVRQHRPETIYTHFAGDINRDHRVLTEALLVAARPWSAPWVREILMFETPSSTEWSVPELAPPFQPNTFVDISSVLTKKLEAFACYTAELREYPHPRSLRALEERARYWGSLMNMPAAEPFRLVRSLR
jgi:LmbE family N-acetylglucosaminyl deacetylase